MPVPLNLLHYGSCEMYETAAAVPAACGHVWPHLCVCGPHCGLGCDFACLFSLSFAMDTPDFAEVLRVSWQSFAYTTYADALGDRIGGCCVGALEF